MEKSFPFNAALKDGVPDRVYAAEDFAAERAAYVSNGVVAADALIISPSAAGGLAVDAAPGIAVIDGYTYFNTAPLTLAAAAADAALPRIDLAVLRLDLDAREMRCVLRTGVPAAEPVMPVPAVTETVHEIPLAAVRIAAGAQTVTAEDITDLRVRADYILNRLEVSELLAQYAEALEEFFSVEDADAVATAAKVIKTDAGEDSVLCGDGAYRPAVLDGYRYEELVRFTEDGTFYPSHYPTRDGRYDVILQGGGGSGAYGSRDNGSSGGESGGFLSLRGLPLLKSRGYAVTVGAGGIHRDYDTEGFTAFAEGRAGGATSFAGYSVPGGRGGVGNAGAGRAPNTANGWTQNLGTTGVGGSGGDSFLAEGGKNNYSGIGGDGALGSGGGAGYLGQYGSGLNKSGNGGSGVVIIYGVREI